MRIMDQEREARKRTQGIASPVEECTVSESINPASLKQLAYEINHIKDRANDGGAFVIIDMTMETVQEQIDILSDAMQEMGNIPHYLDMADDSIMVSSPLANATPKRLRESSIQERFDDIVSHVRAAHNHLNGKAVSDVIISIGQEEKLQLERFREQLDRIQTVLDVLGGIDLSIIKQRAWTI